MTFFNHKMVINCWILCNCWWKTNTWPHGSSSDCCQAAGKWVKQTNHWPALRCTIFFKNSASPPRSDPYNEYSYDRSVIKENVLFTSTIWKRARSIIWVKMSLRLFRFCPFACFIDDHQDELCFCRCSESLPLSWWVLDKSKIRMTKEMWRHHHLEFQQITLRYFGKLFKLVN